MTKKVLNFGDYVFPDIQGSFQTNFGDGVQRIQRMPDADGGFDNDGESPFRSQVGSIRFSYTLVAQNRNEMEAKRDAANALRSSRPRKLYIRPSAQSPVNRWCMAKVLNVSMPEDFSANTDLFQPVNISFSVAHPFWFAGGTEAATLGAQSLLGSFLLGGNPDTFALNSNETTNFSITIGGNSIVLPRIAIEMENIIGTQMDVTIQKKNGGAIVEQIEYNSVSGSSFDGGAYSGDRDEVAEINCRTKAVVTNSDSATALDTYSRFDYLTAEWISLEPGTNEFTAIRNELGGNTMTIKFYYYEKYR